MENDETRVIEEAWKRANPEGNPTVGGGETAGGPDISSGVRGTPRGPERPDRQRAEEERPKE